MKGEAPGVAVSLACVGSGGSEMELGRTAETQASSTLRFWALTLEGEP